MQGILRFSWCDQIAPKMQAGKSALDSMRASPVLDMPMLNKLKRKHLDSPENPSSLRIQQPAKKQRAEGDGIHQSPKLPNAARLPVKSERESTTFVAPVNNDATITAQTLSPHHAPVSHASQQGLDHLRTHSASTSYEDTQPGASPSGTSVNRSTKMADDMTMPDALPSIEHETAKLSMLQQVIENEINLQILLKHNELRLIEQELAKCQVALEQLRRCELRPYPGMERPSLAVSAGTGPSIASPAGYSQPSHAAPYGVTDGPYTRHYRQWLLQDPQFNSVSLPSAAALEMPVPASARSTRHASTSRKSVSKSISVASRSSENMQSLPNYPPAPKDRSAPLILRRSTDNQLVKLICNNCLRGNFSSIQGFLNHCRIAHKVDYKSHDAAAIDCGRVLNEEEAANVPAEVSAAPTSHRSHGSRSSSTTTTPFKTHHFVHPFNLPGNTPTVSVTTSAVPRRQPVASGPVASTHTSNAAAFTPSSQAPRLSAHFAKFKLGGNLDEAIRSARQKVDLSAEDVLSPEELDSAAVSPSTPAAAGARTTLGVPRGGSLAPAGAIARPQSRKGVRDANPRHRPSPLIPAVRHAARTSINGMPHEVPESPQDPSSNLSPHSHTAESAPGLVSDHEEDEEEDYEHEGLASEEDEAGVVSHSTAGVGVGERRHCTDSMEIDVTVDDVIDEHGVVIRRNSVLDGTDVRGAGVSRPPSSRTAGSPSRRLGGGGGGLVRKVGV